MFENFHIITPVFNPAHYRCRTPLFNNFKKHVIDAGAKISVVELAYGTKPFEITTGLPSELQLRTRAMLWHKERLINLAISRLPANWEYVAWVDGDIKFANDNWIPDTVLKLQYHPVVQMFSHAIDLDAQQAPINTVEGFASAYHHGRLASGSKLSYGRYAHTGYAWAMRRDCFDQMGGLIDFAILGAADNYMAHAMIGKAEILMDKRFHPVYIDKVMDWQRDSARYIRGKLGYVQGSISHYWHGSKSNRGYNTRAQILIDHQFNPASDLEVDWQGVYRIDENKSQMEYQIYKYFLSRNEDS